MTRVRFALGIFGMLAFLALGLCSPDKGMKGLEQTQPTPSISPEDGVSSLTSGAGTFA